MHVLVPTHGHALELLVAPTVHADRSNEGYMHAIPSMNATAVEANEDAVVDARPLGRGSTAVKALVVLLDLH